MANDPLSFDEMREHGLLWAINASVFHPRGFALAFHYDDLGELEGWSLMGDGSETWYYADSSDEEFNAFNAFLDSHRKAERMNRE